MRIRNTSFFHDANTHIYLSNEKARMVRLLLLCNWPAFYVSSLALKKSFETFTIPSGQFAAHYEIKVLQTLLLFFLVPAIRAIIPMGKSLGVRAAFSPCINHVGPPRATPTARGPDNSCSCCCGTRQAQGQRQMSLVFLSVCPRQTNSAGKVWKWKRSLRDRRNLSNECWQRSTNLTAI